MIAQAVFTIITALMMASGGWLAWSNGWIKFRYTVKHDHQEAIVKQWDTERKTFKDMADEALALAETSSKQLKDLRLEVVSIEKHHADEMQAMRDHIRTVEKRLSDSEEKCHHLEDENRQLKSRLYDLEHPSPKITRIRATKKP